MWNRPAIAVITMTVAAAGALVWAHRAAPPDPGALQYPVTGLVVTAPEAGQVRVAHDDIAGYMPAMTMAFTLAEGEPTALAPGDRVQFTLRVDARGARAEAVRVVDRGAPARPSRPLGAVARVKRGDALPELALIDQQGAALTRGDFLGGFTILTFVFTRCPLPEFCPLVTSRFRELQSMAAKRALPSNTRLLSVTIDPEFDTPAVLTAYARAIGADPARWRFAGGDPAAVQQLARAFSVHVERNGALLDHTLATALIDAGGRVREIWRGNGWKASEVAAALRGLGAEPKVAER